MSYCRFGWDNSDVYIFQHVQAGLECCGCHLDPKKWDYTDVAEFLAHLDRHKDVGHVVPKGVRRSIVEDWSNGEFADWDDTAVEDMAPYMHYLEDDLEDGRTYVQYIESNRHMLGWDDEQFAHFKQLMEEKDAERSQAADRPAEGGDAGN